MVELCAINGECTDDIILPDVTSLNSLNIVLAVHEILVCTDIDLATILLNHINDLFCLAHVVVHVVSTLR